MESLIDSLKDACLKTPHLSREDKVILMCSALAAPNMELEELGIIAVVAIVKLAEAESERAFPS